MDPPAGPCYPCHLADGSEGRVLLFGIVACSGPEPEVVPEPTGCPCERVELPTAPIQGEIDLFLLMKHAIEETFPELRDVNIAVAPIADLAYFRAWAELNTIAVEDGTARQYTVQYDPLVLREPPPPEALLAVLVHELGHIEDYVSMSSDELVAFGLWYASQDPLTSDELRDYERQTDEKSLSRGCAEGLIAFREWTYARAAPEILEEKQRNYYTPEEIATWSAGNGQCPDYE